MGRPNVPVRGGFFLPRSQGCTRLPFGAKQDKELLVATGPSDKLQPDGNSEQLRWQSALACL
jgi:hypothetical protein